MTRALESCNGFVLLSPSKFWTIKSIAMGWLNVSNLQLNQARLLNSCRILSSTVGCSHYLLLGFQCIVKVVAESLITTRRRLKEMRINIQI